MAQVLPSQIMSKYLTSVLQSLKEKVTDTDNVTLLIQN